MARMRKIGQEEPELEKENRGGGIFRPLGYKIEMLRKKKHLTRRGLARRAHVSEDHIERIESGTLKNIRVKHIVRLAVALGQQMKITIKRRRRSR